MLDSEKLEAIQKTIEKVVLQAERDTGARIAAIAVNRAATGGPTITIRFELENMTVNIGGEESV